MTDSEEGGSTPLTLQVGLQGDTIVVLFNKRITQLELTKEQALALGSTIVAAAKPETIQ